MKTIKKSLILLAILAGTSFILAKETEKTFQETVSGLVIDNEGIPLPGANVIIKNTTNGTTTDMDGKFTIKASIPSTLIVSFIGYKTKEIIVSSANKTIQIKLQEDSFFMDDITVTARKRVENVQDIPIAITALQAKQMTEMGVTDLTGVANIAPNVTFSTAGTVSGSSSSAVVYMRGVGQNDYTPVVDPGVGIYVDEVYLGRSIGSVLDIVDLRSVEVIRGPQGTLFGRNSIGGAISLTSMDPGKKFAGDIGYTSGSYSRNDVTLSLRGPVSENIGLTFNFIRRNRDGYVERVNVKDSYLGNDNMHGFKVKMKLDNPDSKFGLTFIADYEIEREESAPEQNRYFRGIQDGKVPPIIKNWNKANPTKIYSDLNASFTPFKTRETSLSQNDIDTYGVSANMTYDITNDLESKLIVAYRNVDGDFARQVDGSEYNVFENRDKYEQEQASADLRLTYDTDKFDVVGGLFYFTENALNETKFTGALFTTQTGGDVKNYNYAAYAEATYNITEQFSLTGGARYTNETKKARPNSFRIPDSKIIQETFIEPAPLVKDAKTNTRLIDKIWQKNTFDQVTWRTNASYKVSDNINLYGSVSTGFKSGGFGWRITNPSFYSAKENDTDGDGDGDLPKFDPETVMSYEIGSKFNFPKTGIRLNLAGFYSQYENMQIAVNTGIATFQKNAGNAEIKGLEAELTLSPFSGFLANLSYGYTDAKYVKLLKGAAVSKEDKFILTPKHALSGSISYKFHLTNDLGTLTPNISGHYKSEVEFEAVNTPYTRDNGHTALNASLKYEALKNWKVIVGAENLTNELYVIGGDANNVIGYENIIYARPINYYTTVSYSF